jgi:glycosyltransferase involved in cell wall biosynthesis
MCFHLPIVISDLPGSGRDLVRHGENGFRFPARNVDELCKYLTILAQDARQRKQMGEESARTISQWSYREDIQGILAALGRVTRQATP